MSIRKLRAGRVPGVTANEYVGSHGTIFYDEVLGTLRISDGVTPYGQPLTLVGSDFQFQFGDFVATTPGNGSATLSSANANQNVDVVTNGTGVINVVGNFHVHTIASYDPDNPEIDGAIFRVDTNGYVRILAPDAVSTNGAVNIIGSLAGEYQQPVNTGVMLHITGIAGSPGVPSRVYNDSQNAFSAFVARRYNGTALVPTAVLDGEEIMRISGTSHNGTTLPGTGNQRFVFKALGNQTTSNQGGTIEVWATPQNSTTIGKVATISSTGIILESGKTLTGLGTDGLIIDDATGGNVLTITGLGRPANGGIQTWKFWTNTNIGGPGSYIEFPDSTLQTTAWTGNADTVTLTATNSTAATHYLTFVDSATGNETVRTDTDLTYNPSTNLLVVPKIQSKLHRVCRDAGTIATGGTLTIDFSTDDIVHCAWGDGMTIAYQNYTAGSVIRLMATKTSGGNNDPINLDGVTAANVSNGLTVTGNYAQGTTAFIEFTCVNTTIDSVYIKL